MLKGKTLTDIQDIMKRIGCFNNAQLDKQLIKESLEQEDWHASSVHHNDVIKNIDGKDHNTRIEITPSHTILYNCSKSRDIPSMLEKGPSWEYCNKHAFGKGVYTNFQENQAHESAWINRAGYGDTLVKYSYNGDLCKECIICEPQLWKLSGPLSQQIKRFNGLEEFLLKMGIKGADLDRVAKQGYSSEASHVFNRACERVFSENQGMRLYHKDNPNAYGSHIDDVLMRFGVQGIIHYGRYDGPVAVIFNTDKLQMLEYYTIKPHGKGQELDNDDIKWTKVPAGKGVTNGEVDTRAFVHFFHNKYEGDPRFLRPYEGEMLMKDKKTGKYTFVDFEKAKDAVYNKSNIDVRLFGDFEFFNAQNFMDGFAYVQIDNNESSRFLIDKEGNLYRRKGERPVAHISTYYSDEPDSNVEDEKDIDFNKINFGNDDDDDFLDFKEVFGESIMRIINEALENEDRTETSDGHVELDNFDVARRIMKFDNPDNVYFIQLAERHKDHPDRHYEHNACAYKDWFEVTSVEHLNRIEPVIKKLCQQGEWRAMLYINPRSMLATRSWANDPKFRNRFQRHHQHLQGHEIEVAYGQSKDWPDRPLCFVDVDNDDPQIHKQVLDYIKKMGIKPLDMYLTTNKGLHIILPDKEQAKRLDFSFLDKGKNLGRWATAGMEIDKSMTLYAYVRAQGYGTQKRMQQKLGGK